MSRASLPAWLWLSGQWASGTFALLVISVALWMLAAVLLVAAAVFFARPVRFSGQLQAG
jgi:hypothetical protein